jgi:putative transcriptional regulator
MGVVVNHPSPIFLADALPETTAKQTLAARKDILYMGGPVEPNRLLLLIRASAAPKEAIRIFEDVYLLISRGGLETMLAEGLPEKNVRAYAGYAGWGAGQLEAEIARKDWLVVPGDASSIFTASPDDLWEDFIEGGGQWVRLNQSPTCMTISRSPRALRCSQR